MKVQVTDNRGPLKLLECQVMQALEVVTARGSLSPTEFSSHRRTGPPNYCPHIESNNFLMLEQKAAHSPQLF